MGTPHGAGHAGPRLLEGQNTLDIVAKNLLPGDRVDNGRLNTKEGQRSTAGLGGSDTTERGDDIGASLGLPVCLQIQKLEVIPKGPRGRETNVADMGFLLADGLKVPLPDFRSNGLSN